jgi:hypothetical protein
MEVHGGLPAEELEALSGARDLRKKKQVLWIVLAAVFAFSLWLLNIELTYERNVRHMPAEFQPYRHVITHSWKA